MENSRTVQIFITVIFLGIILSCTVFFGIPALISSPNSHAEMPYHADIPLPENLTAFDRRFYLDAQLQENITRLDYHLFSRLPSDEVLVGREDFLFPLGDADYDYLADFSGLSAYDEETLVRLAKSIEKRRIAYANAGAEYLLAVIPNSQTVYSEYLPADLSRADGESRLEQLSAYLTQHGETAFLDLTPALIAGKESGHLYNNTENSVNALGADAIYRAVLAAMAERTGREFTPIARDEINIFTRYTDGKALARQANIADIVRNRTISLNSGTELKYGIIERIAGMEITYTKVEYKNEIPSRPGILLEFSDEWDKIQLMPFFSNTFGVAAYKTSPAFSLYAVDYVKPNLVVQFIHEYELAELADEQIMLSYNAGLKEGEDPFVTAAPLVLGTAQSGEDRICIVGSCEEGAKIILSGEGIVPDRVTARAGRFMIEAVLTQVGTVTADLKAVAEGKAESVETRIELKTGAFSGTPRVTVGENSMLFRVQPDARMERYSGAQLSRIVNRYMREIDRFRSLSGKNTESVYVYIPDKNTVYTNKEENVRLIQLKEATVNVPHVSVYDVSKTLPLVRPTDRLYLQTGSGLSPFGALSVCRLVMNGLAERDSRISPITYQSYRFENTEIPGGDLLALLGLSPVSITEQITNPVPRQENVSRTNWNGEDEGEITDAVLYTNTNQSLPVAAVRRDLHGTALLPYLAEHFSRVYVLAEGETEFPETFFETVRPDYVFTLFHEYHLPLN
ncbi:MAG: hypothetical protein IJZ02_00705 [Clostridia bacterium]|nr:hypothetical protein [Clostridia bacterium]